MPKSWKYQKKVAQCRNIYSSQVSYSSEDTVKLWKLSQLAPLEIVHKACKKWTIRWGLWVDEKTLPLKESDIFLQKTSSNDS